MIRTNLTKQTACGFAALMVISGAVRAEAPPANPEFKIVSPSTTGIPGQNNMMFVTFGPDGRVWVHGRDFFWQQGGVAALDLETGLWKTYSSAETPLDQWCYDMDFAADGSAWIACDNVIARLDADGETFTAHTPASTGVLVTGSYGDVAVAPDGHVWAANYGEIDLGGGLFEFDGSQWVKHEEPWMVTWTGFGFAPPLNVFARRNGDVWATFLSAPGCMGRYRDGQWTQISGGPIMIAMTETPDGTMYGASAFGTYRRNDVTEQWEQIGTIGSTRITFDVTDGFLYVTQNTNSVARYDGQAWTTFASFPGPVDGIAVSPTGDVWIAAETSISYYDLYHYSSAGQLLRVYNSTNTGMLTYFPPWMYLDHDGHMWFSDGVYGASRLETNENWRNFGVYNGQEEVFPFWVFPVGFPWWQTPGATYWAQSVERMFHDSQGNFWMKGPNIIARSAGGDLSQWTTWTPGQDGFPFSCESVGESADGTIWLGDSYTAYRLDGSAWTEVPIGIPGQFASVHGWTVAPDGSLWVARVGTLYRYADGAFEPMLVLPDVNIGEFKFAPNGALWIATSNGLKRWNGTTMRTYTPANSSLKASAIVSLDIRPDGLVAVASSQQGVPPYEGGVALFDGTNWTSYDYGSSFLPFYAVGQVRFDADGHLWIAMLNFGAVKVLIGSTPEPVPGDLDGNGDVDIADFELLAQCLAGPVGGPAASCPSAVDADFDADGDVDLADFALFARYFAGPT
jgi:hypothetical protein